jgi:hypothetical protein
MTRKLSQPDSTYEEYAKFGPWPRSRVGDRIRFRLYSDREVAGVIRAILKTTSGVVLQVEYGNGNAAKIDPDQIIRPSRA